MCVELLPEAERRHFQDHLAKILIPLQEKDGSWWDFPLYDYHRQYGTAMALCSMPRHNQQTAFPIDCQTPTILLRPSKEIADGIPQTVFS